MKRLVVVVATAAALVSVPAPVVAAAPELRSVPLPFLWSQAGLLDVASDRAGGVWISGVQGKFCLRFADSCIVYSAGNPVVRRWVGSSWKEYPINGWTGRGEIARIASGAGETWIAGGPDAGEGLSRYVARFDGSAFQKVTIPADNLGMVATSPAGTFITHWTDLKEWLLKRTGDTWTTVAVPGLDTIGDVQGISATDVWAVGSRRGERGSMPAVAHFDGVAWTGVPLPAGAASGWFLKVVPVAADDVWAITQSHLTHWNGTAWTLVAGPAGTSGFADLTVDASGTLWASTARAVYRYGGGSWEAVTTPEGAWVHDLAAVPGGIWGTGSKANAPAAFTGS